MTHHPFHEHRAHKVEHKRVSRITKGYAAGGTVEHSDEAEDRALVKKMVKHAALKEEGGPVRRRADKPTRAKGGRMKGKGGKTVVNVITGGGHPGLGPMPPMPMAGAMPGPRPMPVAMPTPPAAPGAAPPMMPGGMSGVPPRAPMIPMRARGGKVKGTKVYEEGVRLGTQVQHTPGKNDLKDMGRKKPVTYAKGGPIEAPKGMGPHFTSGAGGGRGRREKIEKYDGGI